MAPRLPPVKKKAWELALEQLDGKLEGVDLQHAAVRRGLDAAYAVSRGLKEKVARKRIQLGLKAQERTAEAETERRYTAAVMIQAFWRSRIATIQVQVRRARRDHGYDNLGVSVERMKLTAHLMQLTVLCHNLVYTPKVQMRMAKVLVKWWRGVLRRRQRMLQLFAGAVKAERELLAGAATLLQAFTRGFQARGLAARLLRERDEEEEARAQEEQDARVQAAVVIERFARGLLARRAASQRRDELRALGAKKDASGAWVVHAITGTGKTKVDSTKHHVVGGFVDRGIKLASDGPRLLDERKGKKGREERVVEEGDSPLVEKPNGRKAQKRAARGRPGRRQPEDDPRSPPQADRKKLPRPPKAPKEDAFRRAKAQAAGLFSAQVTQNMCELLRTAVCPQDEPPPRMVPSTYAAHPEFAELARSLFTVRF